jgi:hypothetical protein
VYGAVRALERPSWRWALFTGLAIGLSFWVRTVALSSALLVPVLLLALGPGTRAQRLRSGGAVALGVVALALAYVGAQALFTGYVGYERQSSWDLYARVSTFVDCSRFEPPPGTRFLCPAEPPGRRLTQNYYQYAPAAPAVRRFGGPGRAPGYANSLLGSFARSAIEHEPLLYAGAVVRGLGFYVLPREGEGYSPAALREELLNASGERAIEPAIAAYYAHSTGYSSRSALAALDDYERHTRIQGALLVLMLLAAIAGIPCLAGRARAAGLLFTLTALGSICLAVATNSYDARYAYPTFAPLAAGAAVGAWGIYARLRVAWRRHRARVEADVLAPAAAARPTPR